MAAADGLPPPPPPPPTAVGPSRSAPIDDERRRRAERERRKSQGPAPPPDVRNRPAESGGRVTNFLKRETPFVVDVRFRNELPEPPCDPKALVAPLNLQQLAAFRLTTLEKDPKRDLVLEPDLGIALSVFDIERYSVPPLPPPLAPEDQALLEGDDDHVGLDKASPAGRVRQRLRGSKAELSWLMRTTYISNDAGGQAATKGIREKEAKAIRDAVAGGEEEPADPLQAQLQEIEATFEAARQPPVHLKNPSLQPVEVLPVLPDEERWPNEYVQLVFDGEPTAEVKHLRGLSAAERRRYAEHAVAKPYRVTVQGEADQSFLALMLPASAPQEPRAPDASPSGEETELRWIREYGYNMRQDPHDQDFVFMFGDGDGAVSYVDMNFKLTVTGRGKKQQLKDLATRFNKPSRMTIKRRPPDETEDTERAKRLHILTTGYDEEAAAEEEEQVEEEEGAAADAEDGAGPGEGGEADAAMAAGAADDGIDYED